MEYQRGKRVVAQHNGENASKIWNLEVCQEVITHNNVATRS